MDSVLLLDTDDSQRRPHRFRNALTGACKFLANKLWDDTSPANEEINIGGFKIITGHKYAQYRRAKYGPDFVDVWAEKHLTSRPASEDRKLGFLTGPKAMKFYRKLLGVDENDDVDFDACSEVENTGTLALPPTTPVLYAILLCRAGIQGVKVLKSWRRNMGSSNGKKKGAHEDLIHEEGFLDSEFDRMLGFLDSEFNQISALELPFLVSLPEPQGSPDSPEEVELLPPRFLHAVNPDASSTTATPLLQLAPVVSTDRPTVTFDTEITELPASNRASKGSSNHDGSVRTSTPPRSTVQPTMSSHSVKGGVSAEPMNPGDTFSHPKLVLPSLRYQCKEKPSLNDSGPTDHVGLKEAPSLTGDMSSHLRLSGKSFFKKSSDRSQRTLISLDKPDSPEFVIMFLEANHHKHSAGDHPFPGERRMADSQSRHTSTRSGEGTRSTRHSSEPSAEPVFLQKPDFPSSSTTHNSGSQQSTTYPRKLSHRAKHERSSRSQGHSGLQNSTLTSPSPPHCPRPASEGQHTRRSQARDLYISQTHLTQLESSGSQSHRLERSTGSNETRLQPSHVSRSDSHLHDSQSPPFPQLRSRRERIHKLTSPSSMHGSGSKFVNQPGYNPNLTSLSH